MGGGGVESVGIGGMGGGGVESVGIVGMGGGGVEGVGIVGMGGGVGAVTGGSVVSGGSLSSPTQNVSDVRTVPHVVTVTWVVCHHCPPCCWQRRASSEGALCSAFSGRACRAPPEAGLAAIGRGGAFAGTARRGVGR
jgi:hypothetical protein